MAVSKVILNGNTLIDVTQKTVDSSNLLSGETALKNDGTNVVGAYAPTIGSLTVNPSTADQVFYGCEHGSSSIWRQRLGSTTPVSFSNPLTVGNIYYADVKCWFDDDYSVRNTRQEYFECTSEAHELGGGVDVSISSTAATKTSTYYDYVDVAIYSTTKTSDGYLPVTVVGMKLQGKQVTPTTSSQAISADSGYDGMASVIVQAMPSGTAGTPVATKGTVSNHSITVTPSVTNVAGYISGGSKTGTSVTVSASELVSGTKSIGSNGTGIDVTNYAAVDVSVNPSLQSKTNISPTTSSQTISADSGYYGLSSVQINAMPSGTVGTPTATKGTVSNHSIAVTPSVTNTTGYITGSTISGTAVTVSASELVSGTKSITANGTGIDVTDYASVDVAVTGGTVIDALNVTTNGTYTAQSGHAYSPVTVNVGGEDPDAVLFYDYDGTVLHRYSKTEFNALTEMPANPTHTGLTSQGWNWSLSDAKAHLVNHSQLDIGQNYITTDGKTKLHITLTADDLDIDFYFYQTKSDGVSVDWGDGSTAETIFNMGTKTLSHTYSASGNYTINVDCTSGTWQTINGKIGNLSSSNGCFCDKYYILKGVNIGSGFNPTSSHMFSYNSALEYVTIPSSLTSLSTYPFRQCYALKQLTIPNGTTSLSANSLYYNYSIKSVSLPYGITNLNSNNFIYCNSLERLIIPDSVTDMGTNNFSYLYNLRKIEYPIHVNKALSIASAPLIKSVTIPEGATKYGNGYTGGLYGLESVNLPSTLTEISSNAFIHCQALKTITIPNSVTSIGSGAFNDCTNITSLSLPSGLTSIGNTAFSDCYRLQSLTIPSGVSVLDTATFKNCYSLKELSLPNGITIKSSASSVFQHCEALKHINIGISGGTKMGSSIFDSCYSLLDFTIPNTVTEIGSSAFAYCYSLTSMTIPSSVTTIGNSAFSNCYSMQEYHLLPTNPPTLSSTNVFNNIPSDCVIYVPSASLDAYKTASNWSTYASRMVGE